MSRFARNVFATAALVASFAGAAATDSVAQSATDLKCKGCVGKRDLGRNAVTKKALRTNSVTSSAVRDGTLTAADMHGSAKPAGVDFADGGFTIQVPNTLASVLSTTVTALAPGYVVAMANWFYSASDGAAVTSCFLSDEEASNDGPYMPGNAMGAAQYQQPASLLVTLPVEAGDTTIHLNCYDVGTDMTINHLRLTALFVPARY